MPEALPKDDAELTPVEVARRAVEQSIMKVGAAASEKKPVMPDQNAIVRSVLESTKSEGVVNEIEAAILKNTQEAVPEDEGVVFGPERVFDLPKSLPTSSEINVASVHKDEQPVEGGEYVDHTPSDKFPDKQLPIYNERITRTPPEPKSTPKPPGSIVDFYAMPQQQWQSRASGGETPPMIEATEPAASIAETAPVEQGVAPISVMPTEAPALEAVPATPAAEELPMASAEVPSPVVAEAEAPVAAVAEKVAEPIEEVPVASVEILAPAVADSSSEEEPLTAMQFGVTGAEALRKMQEEMDATPSADIHVGEAAPTPEAVPAKAPAASTIEVPAMAAEPAVAEVISAPEIAASPSPEDVEKALSEGKSIEVPEAAAEPVPAVAEVVAAEAPAVAPEAPLAEVAAPEAAVPEVTPPSETEAAETAAKTGPEAVEKERKPISGAIETIRAKGMESARDVAISAREGFTALNEDAKKFMRRLYLTGPIGAVRGAQWRASFMYNDALVRFYGGMARKHRLERKINERALVSNLRSQRDKAQSLAEVAKIGGNEVLPKDIAKSALRSHEKDDHVEIHLGYSAAEAGKKEEFWGKRGERFMERRDAALANLEKRSKELLEVVGEKTVKAEKARTKFDEQTVPFRHAVEERELAFKQLQFKYAEAVTAGKIKSPEAQKLMERNEQRFAGAVTQAKQTMASREHRRGELEQRLDELKKTEKVVVGDRERDQARAASKYARTIRNENDTGVPEHKWQQELAEEDSESIPPLSADEYIRNWNWFFGSDERIDASNFKKVTGMAGSDPLPVREWDAKFINYMSVENKNIPKAVIAKNLSMLRSLATSLSAPGYLSYK